MLTILFGEIEFILIQCIEYFVCSRVLLYRIRVTSTLDVISEQTLMLKRVKSKFYKFSYAKKSIIVGKLSFAAMLTLLSKLIVKCRTQQSRIFQQQQQH
jgi:hypothetical protein